MTVDVRTVPEAQEGRTQVLFDLSCWLKSRYPPPPAQLLTTHGQVLYQPRTCARTM
jgi:hypothetical protein